MIRGKPVLCPIKLAFVGLLGIGEGDTSST